MGFSVYGRMGGNSTNNTNNYGRDSYCPKVLVSRSRLGVGYSTPRVNPAPTTNVQDSYNPKTTAFYKKENKTLKTTLLVLGAATAAFVARKPIEKCVTAVRSSVGKAVGPTVQKVSKVTIGDACKAPGKALKKVGSAIAKPFVAVGKLFAKKP